MARSIILPMIAVSFAAGCASTPPPLTADNPASPHALEARVKPLRTLERDAITQRTRQMLAQAAKQQEEWDKNGPVSGDQEDQKMQNMPGMQQSQHKQTEQMPGMQMPQEQTEPSPTPNNN
jgi:hypothetical protein